MYTVIVPLDGSDLAEQAISSATVLARVLVGKLQLLQAAVNGSAVALVDAVPIDATHDLSDMRLSIPDGQPVVPGLQHGYDALDLVLVMAAHDRPDLSWAFHGAVDNWILSSAGVPVMLVKQGTGLSRIPTGLLVPVDGSIHAEQAFPLAGELARRSGATIFLTWVIHSYTNSSSLDNGSTTVSQAPCSKLEMAEWLKDEAKSYLDSVARRLRGEGVNVTWEVRMGQPADEIVRAAATMGVDLIVMSSSRFDGIHRSTLGSVAADVVTRSSIPVLIVPATVPVPGQSGS